MSRSTIKSIVMACQDERGGETLEWPLVLALVIVIALGGWIGLQNGIRDVLDGLTAAMGGGASPP